MTPDVDGYVAGKELKAMVDGGKVEADLTKADQGGGTGTGDGTSSTGKAAF